MHNRLSISTNTRLLATLAVALVVSPAMADEVSAELEQVRQKVADMFDLIGPEDVSTSPVEGWYMIHKGSVVVYISADGRYLLQGDMIDLDQDVNLSESARNAGRRELLASLLDDQVILFSPAEVKYSVSIFTDVECTYCRRLHSQINDYMAHGIEVRYLLYPRNGPTSRSWTTSKQVWCSEDRRNALTMAKLDRDFSSTSCETSMVQDHYSLGRDIGLSGTPAIVLDDGTLISGYLPPDQLKARLDQNASAKL